MIKMFVFVFLIHLFNYHQDLEYKNTSSFIQTRVAEHVTNWKAIIPYLGEQQKVKLNLSSTCRSPIINDMQIDNIPDKNNWEEFDDILLRRAQKKVEKLKKIKPSDKGMGKGIVYVSSSTYYQITLAGLLTLRAKTDLKIEVFHHDELNANEIKTLQKVKNVKVVSLVRMRFNNMPIQFSGGFRNYHLKLAALLASSFQEVLYMDDDNYLMQDPIILFESMEYLMTGMLLWKDVWKTNPKNPVFEIFGVECREGFENESGQLLINKDIHYETLILGYQILQQHDYWYSFLFGDKDVFRFAALALDKPFYEIERLPTFVGYMDESENMFCGLIFLHKWTDGSGLFFHANNAKYRGMISKSMFDYVQYNKNDQDLSQTTKLTTSKGLGCTTYIQHPNSTTQVITEKSTKDVNEFIDLWFGKIMDTNALINNNG